MDDLIVFAAKYLVFFVVLGLLVAWLLVKRQFKLRFIIATVLAGMIALIISRIASHLFYNPRPFVSQHITPLIAHAPDNGFPSDHALFTSTLTMITFFYNRKISYAMAVLTLLVCIGRVLAHVHSPLDVIAGAAIGVASAAAAYFLTNWIFKKLQRASGQPASDD